MKPRILAILLHGTAPAAREEARIEHGPTHGLMDRQALAHVLQDSLFGNIRWLKLCSSVDLVPELPGYADAASRSLPHVGCLDCFVESDHATIGSLLDSLKATSEACRERDIEFTSTIGLFGYEDGAFRNVTSTATATLEVIANSAATAQFPVTLGCQVHKENVWQVDEILESCERHGLHVRFFVAGCGPPDEKTGTGLENAFDATGAYHLALFLKKLESGYERDPSARRAYRSARGLLLGETTRTAGCPYQSSAVSLDLAGQLRFCPPMSKALGNVQIESAFELYKQNLGERRRIRREHCDRCYLDCGAAVTLAEVAQAHWEKRWRNTLTLDNANRVASLVLGRDRPKRRQ